MKNKIYRQLYGQSLILVKRRGRIFRKIRSLLYKMPPSALSEEIVGLMPIDYPTGQVFYLNLMK
jgi:hypothetical protein